MDNDRGWHLLGQMLWKERVLMGGSLLFTVLAAIVELLPYWIVFKVIELLLNMPENSVEQLYSFAGWLAATLIIKSILYGIAYFLSHQAAYRILTLTRQKLIAKLAYAPLEWLQ